MYEGKIFEDILSEMLSYVSDRYPDIDTRTGSVMYNALAPCALEIETVYHEMDIIIEETFLETASKEYLIKHVAQRDYDNGNITEQCYTAMMEYEVEITD